MGSTNSQAEEIDPVEKMLMESDYAEEDRIFIASSKGELKAFSLSEKRIVQKFGKFMNTVNSVAKTSDNKKMYICDWDQTFTEFDLVENKIVRKLNVQNAKVCAVSPDNKFLVTAEDGFHDFNFCKWSLENDQLIKTWKSDQNLYITSICFSLDNRYQFIGCNWGKFQILDLENYKTIKTVHALETNISSMAPTKNNQGVWISDYNGNIRKYIWGKYAFEEKDYYFTRAADLVGKKDTRDIVLTNDEQYQIIGSNNSLRIMKTRNRRLVMEYKLNTAV